MHCNKVTRKREKRKTYLCPAYRMLYNEGQPGDGKSVSVQYQKEGNIMDYAKMIDHTLLKADATKEQVKKLCEEALQPA